MTDSSASTPQPESYRCPVCGHSIAREVPFARFDAPCPGCGHHIWCRRQGGTEEVLLELLPGRTPEPQDVDEVAQSLIENQHVTHCVVDLSRLELIDSALVARLISMNRRFKAAEGQLVLTGLSPLVRDMFEQLRIDQAFVIR